MNRRGLRPTAVLAVASLCLSCQSAAAEQVTVAVAANFISPLETLAAGFAADTGHQLQVSSGSTGQLYAQIVNGAPFDVLLAADQVRPQLLAEQGLGEAESIFPYAFGRLALWSADTDRLTDTTLAAALDGDFRWLAIAEPAVAPYGLAAQQVLEALGAWDAIQSRLVRGQNIAQTFAMVRTRNAELGFVALSQAVSHDGAASYVPVSIDLHEPIRQDAILLNRGSGNPAAEALMRFLRSAAAAEIIGSYGYSVSRPAAD